MCPENYVQNPPHTSIRPGALGLGQPAAVAINYAFLYFQYLTPIFGAVAADCWVGRYRMILVGLGYVLTYLLVLYYPSILHPFSTRPILKGRARGTVSCELWVEGGRHVFGGFETRGDGKGRRVRMKLLTRLLE